ARRHDRRSVYDRAGRGKRTAVDAAVRDLAWRCFTQSVHRSLDAFPLHRTEVEYLGNEFIVAIYCDFVELAERTAQSRKRFFNFRQRVEAKPGIHYQRR